MSELGNLFMLIADVVPAEYAHKLEDMIQLNQHEMSVMLGSHEEAIRFLTQDRAKRREAEMFKDLNEKMSAPVSNLLRMMIKFRKREHLEMVNFEAFQGILSGSDLKLILSKTFFINFSVNEKGRNDLLDLQGLYLKAFTYFHLLSDMRFKSSIDSSKIDMDNPFTRNTIREENRRDPTLRDKYIDGLDIEKLSLYILESFFPDIAGIWADHSHNAPCYILEFIKILLEFGLITAVGARGILLSLAKCAVNLSKLEEGWQDKYSEVKKLSDMIRANNVSKIFAKCRENMAAVLMQIMVFLSDDLFIKQYPTINAALDSEIVARKEGKAEQELMSEVSKNFLFFDKECNDAILSITMNYLSNTTYLDIQKSMDTKSRVMVEKVFLYVTSSMRDTFLSSLKKIKQPDLKYFEDKDVIQSSIRNECDVLGSSMRLLLKLISQGSFSRIDGMMDKEIVQKTQDFQSLLGDFTPMEKARLGDIILRIISQIEKRAADSIDYKVAVVKESVPLALLALADYIGEYFGPLVQPIRARIFSLLASLSTKNNNCKGQIFSGDSLYHMNRMLKRLDKQTYLFLVQLCREDNITSFLGGEVFETIIQIFQKFIVQVSQDLSASEKLNIEECSVFILISKVIAKIFKKPFVDPREKFQTAFKVQSVIFPELDRFFLDKMIAILTDQLFMQSSFPDMFKKAIFADDAVEELINTLEEHEEKPDGTQRQLADYNQKILLLNVCFSIFRVMTIVCADGYSSNVYNKLERHVAPLKALVFPELVASEHQFEANKAKSRNKANPEADNAESKWVISAARNKNQKRHVEPLGLDTEVTNFISIFQVIPEQSCLVENNSRLDHILAVDYEKLELFVVKVIKHINSFAGTGNGQNQAEGQAYIFEAVFPLVIKYAKAISTLSSFEILQQLAANGKLLENIIKELHAQEKNIANITSRDVIMNENGDGRRMDQLDPDQQSRNGSNASRVQSAAKSGEDRGSEAGKEFKIALRNLIDRCKAIIEFASTFYNDEQEYQEKLAMLKDISSETYEEMQLVATGGESGDKKIDRKSQALNLYIKVYMTIKSEYLNRTSEPNLMSYFDRNKQNLLGVFESCIDLLLNQTKAEKLQRSGRGRQESDNFTQDFAIGRFWLNQNCYPYFNLLERLMSLSKTARKEFFYYLREDADLEENPNDSPAALRLTKTERLTRNDQLRKKSGGRKRADCLSVLLRIHTDLLYYLNSNASLRLHWWVVLQAFQMISSFFKNLCEGNMMEFKKLFSYHMPETIGESSLKEGQGGLELAAGWPTLSQTNIMTVLVKQLGYLNRSSRISKNLEPTMSYTDMIEKIQPLMACVINLVNEAVTGPCRENQKIMMDGTTQLRSLATMALRLIDDMNSEYMELAEGCLTLLLSMAEGNDPEILLELSKRILPSVIEDRLLRLCKKIYIRELIRLGEFEGMAVKNLSESGNNEIKTKYSGASDAIVQKEKENNKATVIDTVRKWMESQDSKKGKCRINERMEAAIIIEDWEDLFDLYMEQESFSNSKHFEIMFKLVILWQSLATHSKNHKSKLDEANTESSMYFKESENLLQGIGGLSGLGGGRTVRPTEFACVYYFVFNKLMTEIEVVDQQKNPLLVYFPKSPACYMLSDEAKREYREECEIADSNTKMLDLMSNFKLFSIIMESDLRTWRKIGFFFKLLSTDAFSRYTFFCWFLGLALNIVLASSIMMNEYGDEFIYRSDRHQLAVLVMSYILIGVSGLFLLVWMVFKYDQTFRTRLEDYVFDNPGVDKNSRKTHLYVRIFSAFIFQPFPTNYLLHIIFTVIGINYHIICIALNLMLVINISKTTKFVLTSIYLHADQLVLALVLSVFAIFTYSVVIAKNLNEFWVDNLNSPCETLVECFFITVNLGLRNGGGIAESFSDPNTDRKFPNRTIIDASFFMLINVVSLNIIFGIIIDTFSQLRDDQNARIEDTNNNCFVCGNTRQEFSKAGLNFDTHIKKQHDPWKYIYFIMYIKTKGDDELTGLEYYVFRQNRNHKANWIPIGNTQYIGTDSEEQALTQVENKISSLMPMLERNKRIQDSIEVITSSILQSRAQEIRGLKKKTVINPPALGSKSQSTMPAIKEEK